MGTCLPAGRHLSLICGHCQVLRYTAAHIVNIVPYVQILDVPVPQLGDQVVELLQKIDPPAFVEQVIAVPKISLDRVPQRSVCRRTQKAEQLEVPAIVSYSSLQQRTAEQIIDIPVPQWSGRPGRPSRFLPGTGSTAFSGADLVDIPVPRRGGLHGPASATTSSHSSGAVGEAFTVFFRTFLQGQKNARLGPHSGSELGADFTPWTPAAYADSTVLEDDESEPGSEPGSEVEEDAATRFGAGFQPLRVCMRFLELHLGRPVRGVSPSHTHGLSFTRKLQPMSMNSLRTFRTEAVVAASGPEGGEAGRERGAEEEVCVCELVLVVVGGCGVCVLVWVWVLVCCGVLQFEGVVAIPATTEKGGSPYFSPSSTTE